MEPECCGTCFFFKPKFENDGTVNSGLCRRYPSMQRKEPKSWCGEFLRLIKADEKPEDPNIERDVMI